MVRDLVEAEPLRSRGLSYVHHDSPDARGIDVAMLYDPAMFTLISYEPHFLYIPDNPDFRTRDQLCVTGLLGSDTVSVIVNHWMKIHASGRGTLTYRGQWNLFDQILVGGTLLRSNGARSLVYTGARIMDLDFLKQRGDPRYEGTPWRTYAGGRFLRGYSDHFPTEIFLFAPAH